MRIILGGALQTTPEGSSVTITKSMSDPVPTCTLNLIDNNSTIAPQAMQELLVLDDQIYSNTTANLVLNPSLNPYGTSWTAPTLPGSIVLSQNGGGGVSAACTNMSITPVNILYQYTLTGQIIAGQTYTLSAYVQGSSSPTNLVAAIEIAWYGPSLVFISQNTFTGPTPVSTSLTRYSISSVAPAGAAYVQVMLNVKGTNATNSGTITFTQIMFEPNWFPTMSYPTPWCGPSQTNCVQLPIGFWIRQYRKFAGFVTSVINQNYHGNVRTVRIGAVGYAWILGQLHVNDTFSSKTDTQIITSLLTTYFSGFFSTTNVITGVTVSNLQSNWDDLRTLFDGLAGLSSFYWTVDYYWSMIYSPPGYITMPIGLICDNSSNPDMSTTFPAYNFSAELDYTQPGATVLVIGNGTNVSKVIDPSVTAILSQASGYTWSPGTIFARKVNDSTLASVSDCTQRGMAELIQYDRPRNLYHLTTNQELIAGQGIPITSATENLSASVQLIQQVTATWIGTNETLTDEWEYKGDLGSVNRAATNMISRIHRLTQRNTSAPAISTTALAVLENVGVTDQIDSNSLYAKAVLADSPLRYYRLGEPAGFSITTAYDWSGNTQNGTIVSGVTLGTAGLIYNDSNTAMTFNGTNGRITVPTSGLPSAGGSWTLEAWVYLTSVPSSGTQVIASFGNDTAQEEALIFILNGQFAVGDNTDTRTGPSVLPNTIYHVVGMYNGASFTLYVNNTPTISLFAAPSVVLTYAYIGCDNAVPTNFFPGIIDEVAFYGTALSAARIQAHYNYGKFGHA